MEDEMKTVFQNRNICDIEVEDVHTWDAPDFCDAFISSARWEDTGEFLSDEELEQLNEDRDLVHANI
jgi:hypothetical protein